MEYISTKEASVKWGISPTRITILANEGRIPGAQVIGKTWLIPADAEKPPKRKANQPHHDERITDGFSFPLYPCRTDWSKEKESRLSPQQRQLLQAEYAVLECRFDEAMPLLEAILDAPEDVCVEAGALWNAGICCIAQNKPNEFSRIFLRLQMLLLKDFPYRNDLAVLLEALKTYVQTIRSSAKANVFRTDYHEQALPLVSVLAGFTQMSNEALRPGTAEVSLLEINLRYLEAAKAVFAAQMLHLYLAEIYSLRQSLAEMEKHAKEVVRIAVENKFYYPLVSYYRYHAQIFDSILSQYPEEFQNRCRTMAVQYEQNYTAFLSAICEDSLVSKITDDDYPLIYAVLTYQPNTVIARNLGVSQPTVKRRLDKVCEKLGVKNKKELRDYICNSL